MADSKVEKAEVAEEVCAKEKPVEAKKAAEVVEDERDGEEKETGEAEEKTENGDAKEENGEEAEAEDDKVEDDKKEGSEVTTACKRKSTAEEAANGVKDATTPEKKQKLEEAEDKETAEAVTA